MSFFKDWFFNKLPSYYWVNDSYKDSDEKGLLQRYLENIGEDIDDNILPFIDNLLDIIDPTTQASTDFKYLNNIAYSQGSPPDLFLGDPNHNEQYAKLLSHIVPIYKIKGTKKSFELFFALLGYVITVVEYTPTPQVIYDGGFLFDSGVEYDSGCEPCSEYSILSQSILNNGTCGNSGNPLLDPSIYSLMIQVCNFIQPINVILRSIISGGVVCEEVDYCFQEDIIFQILDVGALDIPTYQFDTGDTYDQSIVVSTTTLTEHCHSDLPGIGGMIIGDTFKVS